MRLHKAITYANRYLQVDELAEDVHRRLIELYAAAGNRPAAVQQFEACRHILESELGIEPLPETQAAYQAVLAVQVFTGLDGSLPSIRRTPMQTDLPLVGRQSTLVDLEYAFIQASRGKPQSVLITGELGIGKTRLLREFNLRLNGQGLVLLVENQPGSRSMAYSTVIQALRPALEAQPDLFQPIPAYWLAEASRLLPELSSLCNQPPAPEPGNLDQFQERLFQALSQLVLTAAGDKTVVLMIDDLHWADPMTLDWLAYLLHQAHSQPESAITQRRLMLLAAYSAGENQSVGELQHRLYRLGSLTQIELGPLEEEDIHQILSLLVGAQVKSSQLIHSLKKATDGNPFFLLETLRTLLEAGRIDAARTDFTNLPYPESIRHALEERFNWLTPPARQVLAAASVLEDDFDFDLVQQAAGRSDLETAEALDELVGRQFLATDGGRFRFLHFFIKQAAYQQLSHWRQMLLQRRAAAARQSLSLPTGSALGIASDNRSSNLMNLLPLQK